MTVRVCNCVSGLNTEFCCKKCKYKMSIVKGPSCTPSRLSLEVFAFLRFLAHLPAPCSESEERAERLCCPRASNRTWTPGSGSPSPPPPSNPLRLPGLWVGLWQKSRDQRGWPPGPPGPLVGCQLLQGEAGGPMGPRTGDGGGQRWRETNQ